MKGRLSGGLFLKNFKLSEGPPSSALHLRWRFRFNIPRLDGRTCEAPFDVVEAGGVGWDMML